MSDSFASLLEAAEESLVVDVDREGKVGLVGPDCDELSVEGL
jgi:hypothetical protein